MAVKLQMLFFSMTILLLASLGFGVMRCEHLGMSYSREPVLSYLLPMG
jgi:hypothetical protein